MMLASISAPSSNASGEEARQLVMELGWNSTCYQLLNAGIEHWWSRDRRALVGFVRAGGTAIVAGAPVCEATRLQDTIDEWEMYAAEQRLTVVYFGAEDRLQQTLGRTNEYTTVTLGSQLEWRPSDFVRRIQQEPARTSKQGNKQTKKQ
jgi:phosphatidylglycerol lysyltransferase